MEQKKGKKDNILRRMGKGLTVSMERWLPDAFVFAIFLSLVVFILGIVLAKKNPMDMLNFWYAGFWKFLGFSMQMVLIVITGHCLATTELVGGWLNKLATKATTPKKAVTVIIVISFIASWVNWGFGLVIGALIANKIAKIQKGNDFPLLIASAYTGAISGMFGLSLTAPLLVNTPGHFLEEQIGLIPVAQTMFSPRVLLINLAMFVLLILVFRAMVPSRPEDAIEVHFDTDSTLVKPQGKDKTSFSSRLETAGWISLLVGAAGLIVIVRFFITHGLDLNIDIVNFTFLVLGIILHKNPINYVNAVAQAVRSSYGVILQFPFYAGIMGMMGASGLVEIIANWITSFSTIKTFPLLNFIQVGVVNFFVPSAGGQWMVQGPILVKAGQALGVSDPLTVIAYSFGDLSTNLIQPFWALPVLGIANLKIKDIWGYCFMGFLVFFVCVAVGLSIFI